MTKTNQLLPLGSIVLLEEGLQKLVVVGRGAIYSDQTTGKDTFADYMSVLYPTGLNPETTIFFNHQDMDKIVFKGYSDEDEERFMEVYNEWKMNLNDQEEDIKTKNDSIGF
ncbi:DUF4176 domain-containing protein [Vagococcus salmoninarum]|uniref:DUF4176 domain-containing protein n=1 Tax=Vagococcus salmoninarum TaxID=2739 RepID=A0A429ZQ41_9ENTE|nr:DUF4176 domain-containing protein [Vagococcus salmoninarum]RST95778.1 hypothetical protein CBF35_07370 [Vagococcus salmoninarum]